MIELLPSREVAVTIGPLTVRWYGVMYVLGFLVVWRLALWLQRHRGLVLSGSQWLEYATWGFAGALIGGRLGYAVFYEPVKFLGNFAEIFNIGAGGMSSHGGFIGVALAIWMTQRLRPESFLGVLDVLVVPSALALAFGRIGNLINQELYLNLTGHILAVGKDVLLFVGLLAVTYLGSRMVTVVHEKDKTLPYYIIWKCRSVGALAGMFLVGYALLRFVTEYWRLQPYIGAFGLTRGQLLSLPLLVVGVLLLLWILKQPQPSGRRQSSRSAIAS